MPRETAIYLSEELKANNNAMKRHIKANYIPRQATIKKIEINSGIADITLETSGRIYHFKGKKSIIPQLINIYKIDTNNDLIEKYIEVYIENMKRKKVDAIQKTFDIKKRI